LFKIIHTKVQHSTNLISENACPRNRPSSARRFTKKEGRGKEKKRKEKKKEK
jgi:hypothetical protein